MYLCTRITAYTVSYFDNLSVLATILFLVIFGVVFFPSASYIYAGLGSQYMYFYPSICFVDVNLCKCPWMSAEIFEGAQYLPLFGRICINEKVLRG